MITRSFGSRIRGTRSIWGGFCEGRIIWFKRAINLICRYMVEAHALYRSAGFKEIEEYPESEIPEEYRAHWVFMEMYL